MDLHRMFSLRAIASAIVSCGLLPACGGGDALEVDSTAELGSQPALAAHMSQRERALAATWTECAFESSFCAFTGRRELRYGSATTFIVGVGQDGVACTNAAFGSDPVFGVGKHCWASSETTTASITVPFGSAPAPAPAPAPSSAPATWTQCAFESGICSVAGRREVRYGTPTQFITGVAQDSVACTNAAFGGDPAFGVGKHCYASSVVTTALVTVPIGSPAPAPAPAPSPAPAPAPSSPPATWTECASESATCSFSGRRDVRYGTSTNFILGVAQDGVACTNAAFGSDPAFGVGKHCWVSSNTSSAAISVPVGTPVPAPAPSPPPSPGAVAPGIWVVIGSSTAAGTGASSASSTWVGRLASDYSTKGVTFNNLAFGSTFTYTGLSTSSPQVAGRPVPNGSINITAALAFGPKLVFVAYPTNDTAQGYSVSETVNNILTIRAAARAQGVAVIVQGTQPRELPDAQRALLPQIDAQLAAAIGSCFVEVRSALAASDGRILASFSAGDGIHLNDAGHGLIHDRIKQRLDSGQCVPAP